MQMKAILAYRKRLQQVVEVDGGHIGMQAVNEYKVDQCSVENVLEINCFFFLNGVFIEIDKIVQKTDRKCAIG